MVKWDRRYKIKSRWWYMVPHQPQFIELRYFIHSDSAYPLIQVLRCLLHLRLSEVNSPQADQHLLLQAIPAPNTPKIMDHSPLTLLTTTMGIPLHRSTLHQPSAPSKHLQSPPPGARLDHHSIPFSPLRLNRGTRSPSDRSLTLQPILRLLDTYPLN